MHSENTSSRTVLVTGGSGFIGSNFIHYWLQKYPNDKIVNLDSLTYAGNNQNHLQIQDNPNYSFVKGSICDQKLVDSLTQDVELIVHFAAESHVDRSILQPALFLETNILGTQVLLDAAVRNKVSHFHHISTDEVFGSLKLGSDQQFSETTPYDPRSPYSASKAGSDHLVRAYGETFGLSYTITNCSNNYGQYQFPEKLIPLAITNILEGKKVPIYGEGQQVRDWLYVYDHCVAIDLVISQRKQGETYVVGGLSQDIPNKSVVIQILELMHAPSDQIEHVQDRAGHDERYSVNWSKIKSELSWMPTVTFTEGLEKTIEWYVANEVWWKPLKLANQDFYNKNYKQLA
ncbi:MAG: dTDP-glucose 4,6-dehydratase [Microgenomates group bacterium]